MNKQKIIHAAGINQKPLTTGWTSPEELDEAHRVRLLALMSIDGMSLSFARGERCLGMEVFLDQLNRLREKFGVDYMHTDPYTNVQTLSRRKMPLLFTALYNRGWTNNDFTAVISRMVEQCTNPDWRVEDLFAIADRELMPRVYPIPDNPNCLFHPLYLMLLEDHRTHSYPRVEFYEAFGVGVVGLKSQVDGKLPVLRWEGHDSQRVMAERVLSDVRLTGIDCDANEQKVFQLERLIEDQRIQQLEMLQDVVVEISAKYFPTKGFQHLDNYANGGHIPWGNYAK